MSQILVFELSDFVCFLIAFKRKSWYGQPLQKALPSPRQTPCGKKKFMGHEGLAMVNPGSSHPQLVLVRNKINAAAVS